MSDDLMFQLLLDPDSDIRISINECDGDVAAVCVNAGEVLLRRVWTPVYETFRMREKSLAKMLSSATTGGAAAEEAGPMGAERSIPPRRQAEACGHRFHAAEQSSCAVSAAFLRRSSMARSSSAR
jgi:hypothetical protein